MILGWVGELWRWKQKKKKPEWMNTIWDCSFIYFIQDIREWEAQSEFWIR